MMEPEMKNAERLMYVVAGMLVLAVILFVSPAPEDPKETQPPVTAADVARQRIQIRSHTLVDSHPGQNHLDFPSPGTPGEGWGGGYFPG